MINEGSGWIVEPTDSQYIHVSTFRPLLGSSYITLPVELKISRKGLINIKHSDQKRFLWCHIRHLNPLKIHSERIKKEDKEFFNTLDYEDIKFPVSKNDYSKIEVKNKICIYVFCYENKLTYPVYILNQKFRNSMYLFLIFDETKSHYVYIKDFHRFMFHKTKSKN